MGHHSIQITLRYTTLYATKRRQYDLRLQKIAAAQRTSGRVSMNR